MESIIKETFVTFKQIEQEMYKKKCHEGQEETKALLEQYDKYLFDNRDTKKFRDKGTRKTVIKTVYGEVEYSRHVYQITDENGARHCIFLLDEILQMERVGKFSENFIDHLANEITTQSFRGCARSLSETTGQTVSGMGVWNIVQKLGERIDEEERKLSAANEKGLVIGKKEVPVLFEEIDGVYIRMQREDRKTNPKGIAEMKVGIAYDGWVKEREGRYSLDGKVAFAGFSKAPKFHATLEAKIAAEYNLCETQLRILNGDGADWIKKVPDPDIIFQLDPYHRNKEVMKKIPYKNAREIINDFFSEDDTEGLFEYLEKYRNSLTEDEEIKNAEELIQYFNDNKDGLIQYRQRENLTIPRSPEGLEYRNLGTMENHIYSIVAQRMKHQHRSWKKTSATNLAKILAKKSEGKLYEVTRPAILTGFSQEVLEKIQSKCLTAAKSGKRIGKGYEYPVQGSIPSIEHALRGDLVKLFKMAGY